MIVDKYDLAESVVPETHHYIDKDAFYHLILKVDGARHTYMMMWVAPEIKRGPGKIGGCTFLGSVPPNPLEDLCHHKCVQPCYSVDTVKFRAAYGKEKYIVLPSVFHHFLPYGVLDICSGFAQLGCAGDIEVFQDPGDLLIGSFPDFLF